MLNKDQFYKDILDGLSLFYDSRFIKDIRNTALAFPSSNLGISLNRKQTTSKLWLLDKLYECHGGALGTVHILGGWYGVLSALFLNDSRFSAKEFTSFDLDPNCAPVAESLNAVSVEQGLFQTITADIFDIRYGIKSVCIGSINLAFPNILINTSCEHLDNFQGWFAGIPRELLLILQSNDYFSEPSHVNSVPNLATFKQQAPLVTTLFEGELNLGKYTRFMLIGYK